jgi:hypothetical protein
LARENQRADTFEAISREVLEKKRREGRSETTVGKAKWLFDLATPALGPRPVAEITAPEVLAVLRQVESGRTIGDGSEASGDHRASLSLRRRNRPSHE